MRRTNEPCEVILALDVESREKAEALLEGAGPNLRWVKIGLQTYLRDGPDFVREVAAGGRQVFLDLKLHDIPNTMAKAVESLGGLPVSMLTIHACAGPEAVERCAEAVNEALPGALLLAVTVLTSMDADTLRLVGVNENPEAQVRNLARLATEAGAGGIVCSPLEIRPLRETLPPRVKLVTPGIRPSGASLGDQKRVTTPAEAASSGANYLVIGRPILAAENPAAALAGIQTELNQPPASTS